MGYSFYRLLSRYVHNKYDEDESIGDNAVDATVALLEEVYKLLNEQNNK